EERNPEIIALVDLDANKIEIQISSLFISGGYKKLKRGMPQTKWDMYKETVEDIIAKPVMTSTKGEEHAMHAAGREDIDALCLDWRPFVLEIKRPKTRSIDLKKMAARINKTGKVKVNSLKYSDRKQVIHVKEMRNDKEYRALVELEKEVTEKDLKKLSQLQTTIKQKTPQRVLHRRANKTRNRKVKSIKWKKIKKKTVEMIIKGEAGLYIKELVTGDNGRTTPSASGLLKIGAKVKELDVIKIYK
ncbi:MAG: tRNA pseudouridine(54/55) synthase Pus10, partial [Nanoarchaeota archaeon]|nr:tRNA pseudouridine(54/55) synthase Pus10 [Nanoarchaeota archaeon]